MLNRIIRTEFLKLPSRGNYVLLILLLLVYIGMSYGLFSQLTSSESAKLMNLGMSLLNTQFSLAGILIGIFLISNIGKEFKDGSLRKNIIDGYTRNDFYVGKISVLLITVLFSYLLGILCLYLVALFSGETSELSSLLDFTSGTNFFLKLCYASLWASFLIFLFRKLTISLVMYFVWGIIESVIFQLQRGFREKLNIPADFNIQNYLPRASLEQTLSVSEVVSNGQVAISCFYVLVFLFLPYYLFLKTDIKS